MNKKTTDIVAYLTWVGLVIAFLMGDRERSKFHINQSLVIWVVGTVSGIVGEIISWIPLLGGLVSLVTGIVGLFCTICWFMGLIAAIKGEEKPVPFLGELKLLH